MSITLIAAMDLNRGLGYQNKLLTRLPSDLKHFRRHTEGNICIFGRKTLESIVEQTGHILKNRINIVLTKNKEYRPPKGVFVYRSVEQLLEEYENYGSDLDVYICGGEQTYKEFLPYSETIILTVIAHKFKNVDTYFPTLPNDQWDIIESEYNNADENNPYDHIFITYKRVK